MGKIHHLPVNRVLLPGENKTCLKKLKVINDVNDYDDIHRDGYHNMIHSETDGGDDDDGDADGDDDGDMHRLLMTVAVVLVAVVVVMIRMAAMTVLVA